MKVRRKCGSFGVVVIIINMMKIICSVKQYHKMNELIITTLGPLNLFSLFTAIIFHLPRLAISLCCVASYFAYEMLGVCSLKASPLWLNEMGGRWMLLLLLLCGTFCETIELSFIFSIIGGWTFIFYVLEARSIVIIS